MKSLSVILKIVLIKTGLPCALPARQPPVSRIQPGNNISIGDEIDVTEYVNDLLTTVEDYGKFLVSVMNGDVLSKEVFNEMVSHQVKRKENKYFGLGWEIYDLGNGEYAMSHGGSDEGAKTIVFLLPKSKQGLIIFTNSDNGTNIYLKLITEYLKDFGKEIINIEMKQN